MNAFVAVADAANVPCTVCGEPSPLAGVVDFNKSCLEQQGKSLPLRGVPVYYRRCPRCWLVFADTMLHWTDQDFATHVYNADYVQVDPDYAEARPRDNAKWLLHLLGAAARDLSVIDFGGGSGRLAAELRKAGVRAATIDPHVAHPAPDFARAKLVTAFEVFEHAMRPQQVLDQILALMEPDGAVIFSTLLQPADFGSFGLGWWYAAPRNGHVSLFSPDALLTLLRSRGLRAGSFSDNLHVAFRDPPAFLGQGRPGGR